MAHILVSGLINIETTVRIDSFPINYSPVRYPFFGINSTVSGVGYNVAKALTTLGNTISFMSLIGQDIAATQVKAALAADNIATTYVLETMAQTAQSVILFDEHGHRQINVDLKNIQESTYPLLIFEKLMSKCDLFVLCNINFSRPFLLKAKETHKLIATDVHTLATLDDDYNQEFMEAANILFMSDEYLPVSPEEFAQAVLERYQPNILVIGLGHKGVLFCVKDDSFMQRIPSVYTRPVVNTIGAGDALFSAFVHNYLKLRNPYLAIKKAITFASYKIGATSAADGFLTDKQLDKLHDRVAG